MRSPHPRTGTRARMQARECVCACVCAPAQLRQGGPHPGPAVCTVWDRRATQERPQRHRTANASWFSTERQMMMAGGQRLGGCAAAALRARMQCAGLGRPQVRRLPSSTCKGAQRGAADGSEVVRGPEKQVLCAVDLSRFQVDSKRTTTPISGGPHPCGAERGGGNSGSSGWHALASLMPAASRGCTRTRACARACGRACGVCPGYITPCQAAVGLSLM